MGINVGYFFVYLRLEHLDIEYSLYNMHRIQTTHINGMLGENLCEKYQKHAPLMQRQEVH